MANSTTTKKEKLIKELLKELREVNKNLKNFLLLIPEESLRDYENPSDIRKSFARAIKLYPPK